MRNRRSFLILRQVTADTAPAPIDVVDFEVDETYAASQSNIGPQLRHYLDYGLPARAGKSGKFYAVPVTASVGGF